MPPFDRFIYPVLAAAYIAQVVMTIIKGRRQRRELGASWGRLVWLAFALALIPALPLLTALLMGAKIDLSWMPPVDAGDGQPVDPVVFELFPGLVPTLRPVNLVVTAILWLLAVYLAGCLFAPVWRILGQRVRCDTVTDQAILDRTEELAAQIGTPVPRVLRISASEAATELNASAVGAMSPTIVATDGLLQHLDEQETAAILAHELGHLARSYSRRAMTLVATIAVAVTIGSAFLHPTNTIALVPLLLITLQRLFGRREEIYCDLAAARAVGFVPSARALNTISSQAILDCGVGLTRVIQALGVHPARDLRLHHLALAAPEDERQQIHYDHAEARAQVRVDHWVVAAHLLVLAFGIWAGLSPDLQYYGIGAIAGLLLARVALPYLGVLPRLYYYTWQLRPYRVTWRWPTKFLAAVGLVVIAFEGLWAPFKWPTWIGVTALVIWTWLRRRKQRRLRRVYSAIRDQDLATALTYYDELPERWQRDGTHRTYRAWLLAAMDRLEESRQVLDDLAAEMPRDWSTQLFRADVTGWVDDAAGLAISAQIANNLPRNPYALASHAGDLSLTDNLELAEKQIVSAIRLLPTMGSSYGIYSAILRRRGDLEGSQQQLEQLEAREPGWPGIPIYRGFLHLARGEQEAAQQQAARARAAGEDDRMSLLLPIVRRLEAEIEAEIEAERSATA